MAKRTHSRLLGSVPREGHSCLAGGSPGFSLLELMTVLAVSSILFVMAGLQLQAAMRRYTLITATQTVGAAVRAARYQAVAKNRTLRLRFNCPAPGQLRLVEFVNDPAIDQAVDRCSETAYPFPDPDAAARPDVDGPVQILSRQTTLAAVSDLQVDATGRITPLINCPNCVTAPPPAMVNVSNSYENQTITISGSGQVRLH